MPFIKISSRDEELSILNRNDYSNGCAPSPSELESTPIGESKPQGSASPWMIWLKSSIAMQPWEVRPQLRHFRFSDTSQTASPMQEVQDSLSPWSLMVLSRDSFLRKPLIRLIRWPPFDWLILLVILANCVTLALSSNRPGFDESSMGMAIQRANIFFIAVFTLEAAVKIIALDLVWNRHSYLRNGELRHCFRSRRWLMQLFMLQDGMCWTSSWLSLAF